MDGGGNREIPPHSKVHAVSVAYLGTGPKPGRVGRHLRYDPDDVIRWFREQQEAK